MLKICVPNRTRKLSAIGAGEMAQGWEVSISNMGIWIQIPTTYLKSRARQEHVCNPSPGEAGMKGVLGDLIYSQSSQTAGFRFRETPVPKTKGEISRRCLMPISGLHTHAHTVPGTPRPQAPTMAPSIELMKEQANKQANKSQQAAWIFSKASQAFQEMSATKPQS